MRVIAYRLSLLSAATTAGGMAMNAEPLVWLGTALAVVGLAAFGMALRGGK
ncbi:hypothetical protein [Acidovorax sp. SUPP2825]|uniref:hypothetical protein n=1 Tax=Acidovorax sp. SUPP2825 TaxID=2920879 RepID=UPI0023DE4189|nr:hypothetical protein [Acidovorax sp. SUPP2825]GKS93209.1 hypothetical protein AVAK2825_01760 [Acidovorax sp. SUPP2825]